MTNTTEDNTNDFALLHLSSISLAPSDIVSIQWDKIQPLSKKRVTQIKTRCETFLLESDSGHYDKDVEALKKATKKP